MSLLVIFCLEEYRTQNRKIMMCLKFYIVSILLIFTIRYSFSQDGLKIDKDEQFYSHCFSAMVYHNKYYQGRRGAIELVLHGSRIATNGDIRLAPIPIPDMPDVPMPEFVSRKVDSIHSKISALNSYSALGFSYEVSVQSEGYNLRVTAKILGEIADSLLGKLAFMLEVFPGIYKGKSWMMDAQTGILPYQFNGLRFWNSKKLEAETIANGKKLTFAPEDPLRCFSIEAINGILSLQDGRASTNHKWFIVKSLIGKEKMIEWLISPKIDQNWMLPANIGFSQIGYHSAQSKISTIELDETDKPDTIHLYKIGENSEKILIKKSLIKQWGKFYRKRYYHFDFTEITENGLYILKYKNQYTESFIINKDIFKNDYWRPTLETFIPVQMCHVSVLDRIRLWHGACHLDDALQAPPGIKHFDGYEMKNKIDSKYNAFEHVPFLNKGGWHDAGDNDIESSSNASTLYYLSMACNEFHLNSDQTNINQKHRKVILHEPDGKADLLQQIEQGVLYILGNYDAFGHFSRGVNDGDWLQYQQMGESAIQSDGFVFDPKLKTDEIKNNKSGKKDDRWIFNSKNFGVEMQAAMSLAAASVALREYDPVLSEKCLKTALNIWEKELEPTDLDEKEQYMKRYAQSLKRLVAIELYVATQNKEFMNYILTQTDFTSRNTGYYIWAISRIYPEIKDEKFKQEYIKALYDYKSYYDSEFSKHPYSVPKIHTLFGTGFRYMDLACNQYFLCKNHPDIFNNKPFFDICAYMHGNHPVCNHSLVNGVGAKSITSAYGFNRSDFSYIPGGICAGPLLIYPDFIEFQIEDPFFWVQKEYTIASGSIYVFMMLAAQKLTEKKN